MSNHPSFVSPDENTKIWRYLDFTKFVSLLETRSLFFSTISILRETDEHEGTYNPSSIESDRVKPFSIHDIGSDLLRNFGKFINVNCWHMNDIESVAMWNVYLNHNLGVAIQSTVKKLADNFVKEQIKKDIYIGKIHYLAEEDIIPEPDGFNGLNAALWKWDSYQYENELRAIILASPEETFKHNGLYVPINLDGLIEKIVIAPKSPPWFRELVSAISSKYGLKEKISKSRLDLKPGSLDNNSFSLEWTCPNCNKTQTSIIEPFIVKDYPNDSTIVFSADRVMLHCQGCGGTCAISVRPNMEYKDPDLIHNDEKSDA